MKCSNIEKLKELELKEHELRNALSMITSDIREMKLQLIKTLYGLDVGSVVKRNEKLYRVTAIDPRFFHPNNMDCMPWVDVNPTRKDGTFGKSKRSLYGQYEVVKS